VAFPIYELGFHGRDIRACVDPGAELRSELRPFLVGFVRCVFMPEACHPDANLEETCRFDVDSQTWTYEVGQS
jgi:hypothetical protein